MAAAPNSSLLVENVNKILSVYVPVLDDQYHQSLNNMGVKSHGTITCIKKKILINTFSFCSIFLQFLIINLTKPILFE